jgi:hypothetical protein
MRARRALGALLLCGAMLPAHAQPGAPQTDLALLAGWLAGEWNNHEQAWQRRIDAAESKTVTKPPAIEHVHNVVWPLVNSALGANVFLVQPSFGDDLAKTRAPYVVRLVAEPAESAVRVETLRLREPARWTGAQRKADTAAALTAADTTLEAGCDIWLKRDTASAGFAGGTRGNRCNDVRTWQVSAERWVDGGISSRKARYYTGWLWFRNAGPGSSADDKDTSFTARFLLHNEGQKMTVLRNDGSETPWALELALLTYQNTRKPILKLALVDRATGKSISYTWTDTDGRVLGLNLGWFQAGMTIKAENGSFGF